MHKQLTFGEQNPGSKKFRICLTDILLTGMRTRFLYQSACKVLFRLFGKQFNIL